MTQTLLSNRERGTFKVLKAWRNEPFPVYGPGRTLLLSIERAGSGLFGITTHGVHMNAYIVEGGKIKYWVAQRAAHKKYYPGMLDNTVGGGLTTGEDPLKGVVREAVEEAAFPEAVVLENANPAGVITYLGIPETGLLKPDCIFVYDLLLPSDIIPTPGDQEVENFKLLDIDQMQTALAAGKFKPNCALVIIDFFIRHGILTAENEKDYIEISARLHRNPEFPTA
jgi:8-oxo-dGTP pyrophosphatase MutT (NUDIX family)